MRHDFLFLGWREEDGEVSEIKKRQSKTVYGGKGYVKQEKGTERTERNINRKESEQEW